MTIDWHRHMKSALYANQEIAEYLALFFGSIIVGFALVLGIIWASTKFPRVSLSMPAGLVILSFGTALYRRLTGRYP